MFDLTDDDDRHRPAIAGAFDGALARIEALPVTGMISVRCDLADAALRKAACALTGTDFPDPLRLEEADGRALGWMSPDELLVLLPHAEVAGAAGTLAEALATSHALVLDVSDARQLFTVRGQGARDVLAKLAPVDLSPAAFPVGTFRRTRLAQVPAAFWARADGGFALFCFRSHAAYVRGILQAAARAAPVNFHS